MEFKQGRWSLDELLPPQKIDETAKLLSELEGDAVDIESYRTALSPSIKIEKFVEIFKKIEHFHEKAYVLISYGQLWFSENTQNTEALAFVSLVEQKMSELYNRILFISLWWQDLNDEDATRLMSNTKELTYYLKHLRKYKPHTLSEDVERIINIKDVNGLNALNTIYDMVTSKYVFQLEVNGEQVLLTRDGLTAYVRNMSATLRKETYRELFNIYEKDWPVLSQIYIYQVRNWGSEKVGFRGYKTPISSRNLDNDVSDSVVNTILEVCKERADVFGRYFQLKSRLLGGNESPLKRYDLYAPVFKKTEKKIPYSDALNMVFACFREFSEIFEAKARLVFEKAHIDSEDRPAKRGGAFCYSVLPKLVPWVLVNYTGEPRQVSTIAHELGHAVHSMMAEDKSILTFHPTLPLAETASVFSEMLFLDYLLEHEKDSAVKMELIANAIDDSYATILRQSYFVLFEQKAHEAIAKGKSAEEINDLYYTLLKEQFAGFVDVSADFKYEWITIPHIYHTPFYCYAYSFGNLLSLALYRKYKQEGKKFVPTFLKILSYGGSESPEFILKEANIDINDKGFWLKGFDAIDDMVTNLRD
ncbi:MAG: M3 family oligoendopeptidase [Candidatus Magnetoovum sp. WYHC-5]|nr:M3 family oligoendopeptidase [Candidatus Magnetoovum sp. WYHC-5]